jgi:hypothetical protein
MEDQRMRVSASTTMKSIGQGVYRWFDRISVIATFSDGLMAAAARAVGHSRFLLHLTGKARRFSLVHFQKQYVQNQLLVRQGDCRQCGFCCNLLYTCPMLTKSGRCIIYGSCRPRSCKVFPIDQRDIDEVNLCGGHCGYHFEPKVRRINAGRRS